jgi:hypothetical protein
VRCNSSWTLQLVGKLHSAHYFQIGRLFQRPRYAIDLAEVLAASYRDQSIDITSAAGKDGNRFSEYCKDHRAALLSYVGRVRVFVERTLCQLCAARPAQIGEAARHGSSDAPGQRQRIRVQPVPRPRQPAELRFGSDDYETKLCETGGDFHFYRLGHSHGPTNHRDGTGCPTSLRAKNAHEVYGSCAPRGQQ